MSPQILIGIMGVATALCAISLLTEIGLMVAMYAGIRRTQTQVQHMLEGKNQLVSTAKRLADEVTPRLKASREPVMAVADLLHKDSAIAAGLFGDIGRFAHKQGLQAAAARQELSWRAADVAHASRGLMLFVGLVSGGNRMKSALRHVVLERVMHAIASRSGREHEK